MKTLTFFVFIGVAFSSPVDVPPNGVDDFAVRSFITDLINSTVIGILGQIDDPLKVDGVDVDLNNLTFVTGKLGVDNLSISGISKIVLPEIATDITLAANITVRIPQLTVRLKNYFLDIIVETLVPLYGSGDISITFDDIRLELSAKVVISPLSLNNLTVVLTTKTAKFDVEGLLDNPDFSALVSEILNDVVPEFIVDYKDIITKVLSPIIEKVVNAALGGSLVDYDISSIIQEILLNIDANSN